MDCSLLGFSVHWISRQEYWSGLPFPSSEDLPDPGVKAGFLALGSRFFTTEPPGKPWNLITYHLINLCVTASLGHVLSFVSLQRPLLPHLGSSPKDGGHLGRCQEPVWGTPPMAKVTRKEASAYAKAGLSLRKPPVPEHLPPKPESAYFTYALTYISDFTGGSSPSPFPSEKELTCSSS